MYRRTILEEEARLSQLCGEAYARYSSQVPRLFPLPWKYLSRSGLGGPRFSWTNPNLAGGRVIERALRLLSYPLLLRVAAAVHELDRGTPFHLPASTVSCAAGYFLLNAVGWCASRVMSGPVRAATRSTVAIAFSMQTKRRAFAAAGLVLVSVLSGWWLWDHRHYWFLHNFREVEPGRVYAGGYQYPAPLQRLLRQYHIKTVVSLRSEGEADDRQERAIVAANGARFVSVPIPLRDWNGRFASPKELLRARIDAVQEAADIMADPHCQPVFVHCWAGRHCVGSAIAIYRVKHCGWTEADARVELVRSGALSDRTQWPSRLLQVFCSQQQP